MIDWQQLVEREGPAVWRTIYRFVRNQADADDCLQETFVTVLKLAERQTVRDWPALLKRVAVSRALDRLRRRSRTSQRETTSDVASIPDNQRGPRQQAEAAELVDALRAALALLPARQAEVLCLYELEAWSYEQIAEQFGLRASSVGVLLHRARAKLRKRWNRDAALRAALGDSS